jgi:hypothetical protein
MYLPLFLDIYSIYTYIKLLIDISLYIFLARTRAKRECECEKKVDGMDTYDTSAEKLQQQLQQQCIM